MLKKLRTELASVLVGTNIDRMLDERSTAIGLLSALVRGTDDRATSDRAWAYSERFLDGLAVGVESDAALAVRVGLEVDGGATS